MKNISVIFMLATTMITPCMAVLDTENPANPGEHPFLGVYSCQGIGTVGTRCSTGGTDISGLSYDFNCHNSYNNPDCKIRAGYDVCFCTSDTSTDVCQSFAMQKLGYIRDIWYREYYKAEVLEVIDNTGRWDCNTRGVFVGCRAGTYGDKYVGTDVGNACNLCPSSPTHTPSSHGILDEFPEQKIKLMFMDENFLADYIQNTSVTDCYIPANQNGSDETGTFIYNQDCHYAE